MKTRILITSLALVLAAAAPLAEAGPRGHDQHKRSHTSHHHGHVSHRPRHRYGQRRHHRHYSRHGYDLIAGAVLTGTIVATLDQPRPAGVVVSGPAYAIRNPYAVKRNTWFQRDMSGECFEVRLQHGGTQLWTRTHPRNCH